PAAQRQVGIEHLLLVQGLLVVAGDVQRLDQQGAVAFEQVIALNAPFGQAPAFGELEAQRGQANAKQLLFYPVDALAAALHALLPGLEQLRMGVQQGPDGCEEQQAAAVQLIPQACQPAAKQAARLFTCVLADQQYLAQRLGNVLLRHAGGLI